MRITNHKMGLKQCWWIVVLYVLLPWQPTLQPTDERIYILYTLYNLPEVYLLASLVNFFDNHREYTRQAVTSTLPYSTILYHIQPYSTILYHTLPYSTILYNTLPYSTILYHTLQYSAILCHTLPYSPILYHTLLSTFLVQ